MSTMVTSKYKYGSRLFCFEKVEPDYMPERETWLKMIHGVVLAHLPLMPECFVEWYTPLDYTQADMGLYLVFEACLARVPGSRREGDDYYEWPSYTAPPPLFMQLADELELLYILRIMPFFKRIGRAWYRRSDKDPRRTYWILMFYILKYNWRSGDAQDNLNTVFDRIAAGMMRKEQAELIAFTLRSVMKRTELILECEGKFDQATLLEELTLLWQWGHTTASFLGEEIRSERLELLLVKYIREDVHWDFIRALDEVQLKGSTPEIVRAWIVDKGKRDSRVKARLLASKKSKFELKQELIRKMDSFVFIDGSIEIFGHDALCYTKI